MSSSSSSSSEQPPMRSFMQSLMQANQITHVVNDNALTHYHHLPIMVLNEQQDRLRPAHHEQQRRWEDMGSHPQTTVSPSFPKRRLSFEQQKRQSINEDLLLSLVDQVVDVEEDQDNEELQAIIIAAATCSCNQQYKKQNIISSSGPGESYQRALLAVQQRYSNATTNTTTRRTRSTSSLPIRPQRRVSIEKVCR